MTSQPKSKAITPAQWNVLGLVARGFNRLDLLLAKKVKPRTITSLVDMGWLTRHDNLDVHSGCLVWFNMTAPAVERLAAHRKAHDAKHPPAWPEIP